MELELKFTELESCEPVGELVSTQEEAMETTIPEYCPDIARIVDTVGQLRLREKQLSGQQLSISGSVRLTVLYTSEESVGLRSLSLEVPFSCQLEDKRLSGCCTACVSGRLLLAEARAVTARRLYLRVIPEFCVEGYAKKRLRLCCGAGEDPALRLRRQAVELELLSAVEERELHFTQELPADECVPEELLLERAVPWISSCQQIGSRLVVKGQMECSVLYRGAGQELGVAQAVLPFSQLVDGLELPEGAQVSCQVQTADSEARLVRTEDGADIALALSLRLTLYISQRRQTTYIEDMYSVSQLAQTQREELLVPVAWRWERPVQEAAQQLSFGQGRAFAYLTAADCGGIEVLRDGGAAALRTELRLRVLYLDEAGTPVCAERSAEVSAPLQWEPQRTRADCGLPQLQFTGSECRLTAPVRFEAQSWQHRSIAAVSAVELSQPPQEEQPSLVLRRMAAGETLWEIAKQHRSDEEAIRSANELGQERPEGLLLIPRIR